MEHSKRSNHLFALIIKTLVGLMEKHLLEISPLGRNDVIFIGYGSSQLINKPKMLSQITSAALQNSEKTITQEAQRLKKDINIFTTLKIVWAMITIIGIALFYTFSSDTYKGTALGLLFFGSVAFMTDRLLHHRAVAYHNKIVPVEFQQQP